MNLTKLLKPVAPVDPLLDQIRNSPSAPLLLERLRQVVPDLANIPQTTYSLYREFERNGQRDRYQALYFTKRAQLTRAVFETIMGADGFIDVIHDLLWSICEETSWLVPAHEEQGPDYWDLKPSPRARAWGAHTALTREPDSIDLFAAETGATLAEAVHLLGDKLAPEVCQRVRQEVQRHIFKPYLAYGRKHWWFKGALNWNGVCNGAIGLAFMRLERDLHTLVEALETVLEGFKAYIASGFEADGGSIEGPSYWDYGMQYFVALAELLRERTNGEIDLLVTPRLKDIARYPLGMALASGIYINFGDAPEETALRPGIVERLAERTGVSELRALILGPEQWGANPYPIAKLAITLRDAAWWDGETYPFPQASQEDFYLPECQVVKFVGQTESGQPVALAAKAGHNDGHHSHTDVGMFIYHLAGESLLCDPGRGLYSREYFRQARYKNIFCNSLGHSVPVIAGALQSPGPEFGGMKQYHGEIVELGEPLGEKFVVIDLHHAYDLPALTLAQRALRLSPASGHARLEDEFAFSGDPLQIEEAFLTWASVTVEGASARITGEKASLEMRILEPQGANFTITSLEEACRENRREGVLTRLTSSLPAGTRRFKMEIEPIS